MSTKTCNVCGKAKDITDFTVGKAVCKSCRAKAKRNEYQPNTQQENVKPAKVPGNTNVECECGATYTMYNKSRHMQTNKHMNYIRSLTNQPPIYPKKKQTIPQEMEKIYYGIGPVPAGYRLATMEEEIEAGQVRYWGIKTIDTDLFKQMKEIKTNENNIQKKMDELMQTKIKIDMKINRLIKEGIKLRKQYEENNDTSLKDKLNEMREQLRRYREEQTTIGNQYIKLREQRDK